MSSQNMVMQLQVYAVEAEENGVLDQRHSNIDRAWYYIPTMRTLIQACIYNHMSKKQSGGYVVCGASVLTCACPFGGKSEQDQYLQP